MNATQPVSAPDPVAATRSDANRDVVTDVPELIAVVPGEAQAVLQALGDRLREIWDDGCNEA